MIVVDAHDNDICVVVPTTFMEVFGERLTVVHTYTISNFKVHQNDLVFKPSNHNYMVKFTGGTSINDVDKHEIPLKLANFTSFSDIMTEQFRNDMLLDKIGMVDTIGFSQAQSGGKKIKSTLYSETLETTQSIVLYGSHMHPSSSNSTRNE
ncbi:unnamed protein product [Lathyrus sativus]|nr:unnamed protein product [Lathyrus sativus]